MSAVDDLIDTYCPQCANEQVYVERVVEFPVSESAFLCRCGECGWRFRVHTPDPVAPPLAAT